MMMMMVVAVVFGIDADVNVNVCIKRSLNNNIYNIFEQYNSTNRKLKQIITLCITKEYNIPATAVAAKTLCIPFKQPELLAGTICIASGLPAT